MTVLVLVEVFVIDADQGSRARVQRQVDGKLSRLKIR